LVQALIDLPKRYYFIYINNGILQSIYQWAKFAEKAVCTECIFDDMALYFEKTHSFRQFFFGDFAHWDKSYTEAKTSNSNMTTVYI